MNAVLEFLSAILNSDVVLDWILQALCYGTLLAILTWMIVSVGHRKLSSTAQIALWCIVLLKFVLPVSPSFSFSLARVCEDVVSTTTRAATGQSLEHIDVLGMRNHERTLTASHPIESPARQVNWLQWLWPIYVFIVAYKFLRRAAACNRLRTEYEGLPQPPHELTDLVAATCRKLRVARVPQVRVSGDTAAPFVIGWRRPLLVLSDRHLHCAKHLETVIVHEVAHLRRGDVLVGCFQRIVGTLLFFWPVVYWVNRRIDLARECACDEWALRRGRLSAGEYARCLLDAAKRRPARAIAAFHPAYMAANPATIERRIDMVLHSNQGGNGLVWSGLAVTLIGAWGGFALADGGKEHPHAHHDHDHTPHAHDYEHLEMSEDEMHELHHLHFKTLERAGQAVTELNNRLATIDVPDTNGDGRVDMDETTHYLLAKAMLNPDAVIGGIPFADYDKDGQLSIGEAFHAVSYDRPPSKVKPHQRADVAEKVGKPGERVQRVHTSRADAKAMHMNAIAINRIWILDNTAIEPTADDIRTYVKSFKEFALNWMERHQFEEMDRDGDGELTDEERNDFYEQLKIRSVLEHHPEADLDGDGALSDEELRAFKTQIQNSKERFNPEFRAIERTHGTR